MQFRLSRVLGEVFTEAERELATVDDASPQAKVLRSLLNHREGTVSGPRRSPCPDGQQSR